MADSLVYHHGSANHRQVRCRAVSIPTHYGWKWLDSIIGMLGLWLALALLGSELVQPKQKIEVKASSLTLTER